jgi:hypothetical protein
LKHLLPGPNPILFSLPLLPFRTPADAPSKKGKKKAATAAAPAVTKPTGCTSNKLRAYAIDEAGTQGGMLPVLSELPQLGQQPSSRMYHRAAVDPEAGVMYVYGGVHMRDRDGARLPADEAAGTLHCYHFHSYTWSTLQTTGGRDSYQFYQGM